VYNQTWDDGPQPNPDISAEAVVKIQLDALQNNDISPDDHGIRIAWRFASTANKDATGPVETFIQMVKNPLYRPLIGFEKATLERIRFAGNLAQQRVTLHHRGGEKAVYVFTLSRQRDGREKGCWMTDGVLRVG
jgi:hypothetical protein